MNRMDRIVSMVFIVLTLLIVQFHGLYGIESPTLYLKFGVRMAMFLAAAVAVNRHKVQKLIVLAFLMTVVSDYFFLFVKASNPDMSHRLIYGMVGFIAVYVVLIIAFQRNFRLRKAEIVAAVPFVGFFAAVLLALRQYMTGMYLPVGIVLGVVLAYAGMTMVSTLFRGYFRPRTARFIASAGCLLYISDIVVAYSMFHPAYNMYIHWKENTIWVTYMIGWLLLLIVTIEDRIQIDG